MQTYETDNLILRAFTEDDLEDDYDIVGNFDNVKYLLTSAQSKEQCFDFIRYMIMKTNENPCNEYHFAVTRKGENRVVGSCCLTLMHDNQGGLSWIIHRDCWGRGYGSEIGKFLLKFAFEVLHLRRVVASCDTRNVPSYHIMEKVGMRREGCLIGGRSPSKIEPDFYGDDYAYGILRDEYLNRNKVYNGKKHKQK